VRGRKGSTRDQPEPAAYCYSLASAGDKTRPWGRRGRPVDIELGGREQATSGASSGAHCACSVTGAAAEHAGASCPAPRHARRARRDSHAERRRQAGAQGNNAGTYARAGIFLRSVDGAPHLAPNGKRRRARARSRNTVSRGCPRNTGTHAWGDVGGRGRAERYFSTLA
jgi:hypothetical protein